MDILNQFGINPLLLAAQVVNFLILLFILKRFLYKPLLGVLETRKKKIEESLKNAEELERRLNELTEKEAETILKAGKEGQKIIQEAGVEYARIIEDAKKEYERIIKRGVEDAKGIMALQKIKLEQQIRENLGDIVTLALLKVTGKVITDKQKKQIIEKEFRNIS